MCIKGSKTIVIEGGGVSVVLPQIFFFCNIHTNGAIVWNTDWYSVHVMMYLDI